MVGGGDPAVLQPKHSMCVTQWDSFKLTDVFQPTVLEFALSHCRRLASKRADNRLYMQLARKKNSDALYMSFPKSPTRKIKQ